MRNKEVVPIDDDGNRIDKMNMKARRTSMLDTIVQSGVNMKLSAHEHRNQIVQKQRKFASLQCFFGLLGVLLMIAQLEYEWYLNASDLACVVEEECLNCMAPKPWPKKGNMGVMLGLRGIISMTTLVMWYYQYAFYSQEILLLKLRNVLPQLATVWTSELKWKFALEGLMYGIHPVPWIEYVDPQWPDFVVYTSLTMFSRIVLLGRVIKFYSALNSSNGWFIGSLTNVEFTSAFFLKTEIKNHPMKCMMLCLTMLLIVAGYSLYVVERFTCAFTDGACCEPIGFADAEWLLVITILTIGYGDIVPKTNGGRLVAILGGVMGTLLTALIIALTTNYLHLSRSEHKVNTFLQKDTNRKLISNHAARAVQSAYHLYTLKKQAALTHAREKHRSVLRAEIKMFSVLRTYRRIKNHINANDATDPVDKQLTLLESMEMSVEDIKLKMDTLVHDSAISRKNSSILEKKIDVRQQKQEMSKLTPVIETSRSKSIVSQEKEQNPPEWATQLMTTMNTLLDKVGTLSQELEQVKGRVDVHIKSSKLPPIVQKPLSEKHTGTGKK